MSAYYPPRLRLRSPACDWEPAGKRRQAYREGHEAGLRHVGLCAVLAVACVAMLWLIWGGWVR